MYTWKHVLSAQLKSRVDNMVENWFESNTEKINLMFVSTYEETDKHTEYLNTHQYFIVWTTTAL